MWQKLGLCDTARGQWHWLMEMGQWIVGHGSNGPPFLDGSHGSCVTASDPLTHDDEITAHWLAFFVLS